jgi:hypothetical protein
MYRHNVKNTYTINEKQNFRSPETTATRRGQNQCTTIKRQAKSCSIYPHSPRQDRPARSTERGHVDPGMT